MKIKSVILTVLFSIILFGTSALCIMKPADEYSESERRPLAEMPEISLESVLDGSFMKDFEKYTSEQFPKRDFMRKIKAAVSYNLMLKKDNNGLFSAEGHISKLENPENEAMMNHSAEVITSVYESFLKDKNAKGYFVTVPDKNHYIADKNGYPSLDYEKFAKSMREKLPFLEYIDISDMLSAEDYYNTDTHWKQESIIPVAEKIAEKMGADVSSEYKVNTLDKEFRGVYSGQYALDFKADQIKYLTNETLDNCKVYYYDTGKALEGELYNMEKAYGKDPYELFLSGSTPLAVIENPNGKSDKELVILRDSFGSSLAPLMVEGYKRVTVADVRYIKSAYLGNFINFENSDVLFIYSTSLLNDSMAMN